MGEKLGPCAPQLFANVIRTDRDSWNQWQDRWRQQDDIAPSSTTAEQIPTDEEVDTVQAIDPIIKYSVTAQLPILPDPLRPKTPLLVTVETWSDGIVAARLPITALYGEGETDAEALNILATAIFEFIVEVKGMLKTGPIGGGLLRQWKALQALVEGIDEVG